MLLEDALELRDVLRVQTFDERGVWLGARRCGLRHSNGAANGEGDLCHTQCTLHGEKTCTTCSGECVH